MDFSHHLRILDVRCHERSRSVVIVTAMDSEHKSAIEADIKQLGWMSPAAIIALGLTWREAIYCIILGLSITAIPLVLNGAIGACYSLIFLVQHVD